jgi:hypothetical protein
VRFELYADFLQFVDSISDLHKRAEKHMADQQKAIDLMKQIKGANDTIQELAAELSPEARTPPVWGQRSWSDRVRRVSKVIGLCIPMLEWRLLGLYQHSIHSNTALASSSRVCHCFESSSSSCIVPQNDSIIALS